MTDFLIIRPQVPNDKASKITYEIGIGMKSYLESKGHSVVDIRNRDASPEKVKRWLRLDHTKTLKVVIALDHGTKHAFYGQNGYKMAPVIDFHNVEQLTKGLHVYTLACSTNAPGGLGEEAVKKGCHSWLGYVGEIGVLDSPAFKDCIMSYVRAMAEGKTIEQCKQILIDSFRKNTERSPFYQKALFRLLLRKKSSNMTINSHNRGKQYWRKLWGPVGTVVAEFDNRNTGVIIYATKRSTGDIYCRKFMFFFHRRIGGPGKMFAVDGKGHLYGLAPDGTSVWVYSGEFEHWTKIGGPAANLYSGGGKLFATNPTTGNIYQYLGKPFSWIKVGGPGKMFAVDGKGHLYGLAPDGTSIWAYSGKPDRWAKICNFVTSHIYAGGDELFAIKGREHSKGRIWRYQRSPFSWTGIGGPGKMFAVDDTGDLYGLAPDGTSVWWYSCTPGEWRCIGGPAASIYAGGSVLFATNPKTYDLWCYYTNKRHIWG